jgi:hypothetical protein
VVSAADPLRSLISVFYPLKYYQALKTVGSLSIVQARLLPDELARACAGRASALGDAGLRCR